MGEEEVIRSACCGGTRRSTYQFLPAGVGGTKRTHPLTNTYTDAKAKNTKFFFSDSMYQLMEDGEGGEI